MKARVFLAAVFAAMFTAQIVCAENADRKSVFVNYDSTHFAHSRLLNGIVPDEAEIRALVRLYRGTDVTGLTRGRCH